jgi:hypothetical protein
MLMVEESENGYSRSSEICCVVQWKRNLFYVEEYKDLVSLPVQKLG